MPLASFLDGYGGYARRRREKQPGSSTNSNSASWKAGTESRKANRNSAFPAAGSATRLRSAANENSAFPGAENEPGISQPMRSTPVEHPQTFLRPQHSQSPSLRTNRNSERRSRPDHPEIRGLYKPAQHSIRQDTLSSIHRDSSGSGLSSPAPQRPH